MTESKQDVVNEMLQRAPDALLATYVTAANAQTEDKSLVGLTLQVQGLLITGDLIPAWLWAAELHAQREAAAGVELETSDFTRWQEEFERSRDEEAAVDDSAWEAMSETEREEHVLRSTPRFIHLRGAKVLHDGKFVPANGTLWRGRLAQVDGWFLGTLGEAPA